MPRTRKALLFSVLFLIAPVVLAYYALPSAFVAPLLSLNRSLSSLQEHTTTVAGHQVHYLEGGSGETVILLHGIFAEKDHWVDFARELTPGYRVIAPDIPGFGESSRLADQSYQYAPQVERLHALVQQLGLRQFHLAGNSMGGTIAALYAAKYPGEVLSVAFIGAPHGIRSPKLSELEQRVAQGEAPLIARNEAEFAGMMKMLFVEPPFLPRPILLDAQASAIRNAASNLRLWEDQRRDGYQLQAALPHLKVPTLALWGEQDRVFDISGLAVLGSLLPAAEQVTLPATGHLPMMERPAETATRYKVFLGS